jgi:hypothetical protein
MAITVTSYGAAFPATTFLSEYLLTTSTTFLSGFETGSRSRGTTYYETRNSTRTAISSTTSESTILGTNNGNTVTPVEFESLQASDANSVGFSVFNTAIVSTVVGTTEVFVVDTDYEDGGYFEEQTFAQTQTTRDSSTATTTTATSFTTSRNSADEVSFYTATTTKSVTTSTTATATFETFGTSAVSSSRLSRGVESTEYVYAAPDEVLWVASATGFDSQAIITAVGSTATSHSRKLGNASTVNITTNNANVTWAASTHGTLSETGSFTIRTFAAFTTTIIRTLTSFSVGTLTGNVVSSFSNRLPHLTDTYTTQTFTTSTSSYVRSNYSLVAAGGSGASSEALTSSGVIVSRYPVRVADRGLEYEQLRTIAVSTSFPYTRAIPGYSLVTKSGATVAGNSLVTTGAPAWFYLPAVFSDTSTTFFNNVHVLNRRTGGFMTYTDEVSGWLTGLTVGSDSSLATTITFAQHRRGRYVPLPGSFAKYTVSKDSFTYTRSTSTNSTTASTTTSTLLDLAGGTSRIEEGLRVSGFSPFVFGFYSAQTIGGGVPSGETNFANVVGPAKINNSTVSTFGGSLSSTTDTSGTASFVNALATMYAVTATGTANDIVTQRNITSMV